MKIQVIFFENKRRYMIFAKLIQYFSRKNYKSIKHKLIPNHVGHVIDDVYFESALTKKWLMKKYDNNLIAKFKKDDIIETIVINIATQKHKALNIAKKNIKQYSILKACASFDFQSIAGLKVGLFLNAVLDFFSKRKKHKTFCSEYFVKNILEMMSKANRDKFLKQYIKYLKEHIPFHPVLNKIKNTPINKLEIDFLAKETTPIDIYLYLKNTI